MFNTDVVKDGGCVSSHAEREAEDSVWVKNEQNCQFRHCSHSIFYIYTHYIMYLVGGYSQGGEVSLPPANNETLMSFIRDLITLCGVL